MQNITIHLPDLYLKLIDEMNKYPCTSEFIRFALRKLLKRDFGLLTNPSLGRTSNKVQELIAEQQDPSFKTKLDQYRALYAMNSVIQTEISEDDKRKAPKQVRIEKSWKK